MRNICRIITMLAVSSVILDAEQRTWTRESDQKTIEAEYLSADSEKVVVLLRGKEVSLNILQLVSEDQEWVRGKLIGEKELQEKVANTPAKNEKYLAEGGKNCGWTVRYPKGVADYEGCPLLILYSAGGKPSGLVRTMSEAADSLGWILVGSDSYSNGLAKKDYAQTLKDSQLVFEHVREIIPHDENKVMFGGMSGGAWWSYVSTAEVYNKATGVLAFGGWMSKQYELDYPRGLTVAMINGDKDKNANAWIEPDSDFLTKKKRAEIKVFHFPGGHIIAPSSVAMKAAEWISETAEF